MRSDSESSIVKSLWWKAWLNSCSSSPDVGKNNAGLIHDNWSSAVVIIDNHINQQLSFSQHDKMDWQLHYSTVDLVKVPWDFLRLYYNQIGSLDCWNCCVVFRLHLKVTNANRETITAQLLKSFFLFTKDLSLKIFILKLSVKDNIIR